MHALTQIKLPVNCDCSCKKNPFSHLEQLPADEHIRQPGAQYSQMLELGDGYVEGGQVSRHWPEKKK